MLLRHNVHHSDYNDRTDKNVTQRSLSKFRRCTRFSDDPKKIIYNFTSTQEYQRGLAYDDKGNNVRLSDNQVAYCWRTGSSETLEYDNLEEARKTFTALTGCQPIIMKTEGFKFVDKGDPWDMELLTRKCNEDPTLLFKMIEKGAIRIFIK